MSLDDARNWYCRTVQYQLRASFVFLIRNDAHPLFLYAEKDREIETSGVECRLNGHPLSRGIFYPKGSRAPGFVIGHQCVSVLETFPLWETFRSVPLFRTDAHPHVPVRHRTDGRVQVRAQRGSVRLAATSAAGHWSCPCARRRRCSGTSSRSARELVPCRAAASLKRSPRVARARLVRGRADRRLADERRVQAG